MEEALVRIGDFISGLIQNLLNFFVNVGNFFESIENVIINIASFLLSIFGFIRYGLKTLITGVGKLIYYITGSSVPSQVAYTLGKLSTYIGPRGVLFISALLLIIIVRILYAFVHKMIFRPDYKMSKPNYTVDDYINNLPTSDYEDRTYPRLP